MDVERYHLAGVNGLEGGPLTVELSPTWIQDAPAQPLVLLRSESQGLIHVGSRWSADGDLVDVADVRDNGGALTCSCGVRECDHVLILWHLEAISPETSAFLHGRPSSAWHAHEWVGYAPPTYDGGIYEDEICEGCGWHRLTETHDREESTSYSPPYDLG